MSKTFDAIKMLSELENLLEGYSNVRRATTQPYNLLAAQKAIKGYSYNPDEDLIRESLIEHVGQLPIIATALFPYIKDDEVDLGKALTMLAIHDIGELETGDVNTFTKQIDTKDQEQAAAKRILHHSYHELYDEVESRKSTTAKFAKSVDKIAPDILDYLSPAETTIARYRHFVGVEPHEITALKHKHKLPYMLWNPFMVEFHKVLTERLQHKLDLTI